MQLIWITDVTGRGSDGNERERLLGDPHSKKFASASQEHLNEKSPVFLNICYLYQQQPGTLLKPFANPVTVVLSPRVSAVSTSPSLSLSQAFLATGCVLCQWFFSTSAKTSHIHLSKLNNVRKVTLVWGSQLQLCPSSQAIPMKCSWVGTEGSSSVTFRRWFQCSSCFSAVPILKQKRAWHDWHGQPSCAIALPCSKTASPPLQIQG